MQKFDDRRKPDRTAILAPSVTRGKKQQRGTQALPAPAKQIRGDFGDGRKRCFTLARELFLDEDEVFANQIKYLFDRQKGDDVSPRLNLFPET